MKKWLIMAGISLCLLGGWAVTAATLLGGDDTAATVESYRALAQRQMDLGGYGVAIDCYNTIVKLDDTMEHRLEQAQVYLRAGYTYEYKKALKEIIRTYPEDSRGYEALVGYFDGVEAHSDCVEVVQEAAAAGVRTETLNELYYKHAFQFTYLKGSYESASPMKYGTAVVGADGVWWLINSGGQRLTAETYQSCANFAGGAAAVKKEERCGYITQDGLWYLVLPEGFERAYSMSQGLSVVFRDGGAEYVDASGAVRMGPYEDATGFSGGVAAVKAQGVWRLIDLSGETIGEGTYQDVKVDADGLCASAGVIFVKTADGWQLVDKKGKACSELYFDEVEPFFDGTYAAVCAGGKWGFVSKTGDWALEPRYEGAGSFGRGLAAVKQDGKWGYVDATLRIVIEPQFDQAGPFASCGVAPVQEEDGWRYIRLIV